jgi:hypothetical protein
VCKKEKCKLVNQVSVLSDRVLLRGLLFIVTDLRSTCYY